MVRVEASFDDGTVEDVRVAEMMARYEIPTTFYWPVDRIGTNVPKNRMPLSQNQCDQILSNPLFELGSHTITHPHLTRITADRAKQEIEQSKGMLERAFGRQVLRFCYPRGYANDSIRYLVEQAGYESARNTGVGNIHESEDPYWTTPTVHVGYDREEYGERWIDYALKMHWLAQRQKEDTVYHLWGHGWEIEKNNGWDDLEMLMRQIRL